MFIKGLCKWFNIGDYVKVIGISKFEGEVGIVVDIFEDWVMFFIDNMYF